MSCCQQVHMTLLFVSWKTSAGARAFFSQISLRGSHAAGTSTGLLREGKILRLCLKCVRGIEKSVWKQLKIGEMFFSSTKLAYIFIPSLHLYLQRENPSVLKDYVIKMLAGLTTDYLHVSIAMTLCRALYYTLPGIYCTSAFLKLSNCLGNPLICFLLVTMWRESRLRASERRLVNKAVEVLRDLKLTLSVLGGCDYL